MQNFPAVWARLEELVVLGRLVAPQEVRHELAQKEDHLKKWARRVKQLFVPDSSGLVAELKRLLVKYPGFQLVKATGGFADPWIIALACLNGGIVVTEETGNGHPASVKIPDVCRQEGVLYVRLVDVIRREGWTFK